MTQRLLLVDDHGPFRRAARSLLEDSGWQVVGEAATAAEAAVLHERLRPDVVLLDVALPDGNGFDLAPTLAGSAVVLVSSRDWADLPGRVHGCGARGFLRKEDLTAAALSRLVE